MSKGLYGGWCNWQWKTEVLAELRGLGLQVIDLEALACHKGSVFGHLGEAPQPTSEQFHNLVAMEWALLDPSRFVYLEDEHTFIANVQHQLFYLSRSKEKEGHQWHACPNRTNRSLWTETAREPRHKECETEGRRVALLFSSSVWTIVSDT